MSDEAVGYQICIPGEGDSVTVYLIVEARSEAALVRWIERLKCHTLCSVAVGEGPVEVNGNRNPSE